MVDDDKIRELKGRYRRRLDKSVEDKPLKVDDMQAQAADKGFTSEYKQFKNDAMPAHYSLYEKLCNWSEKIFKIKIKEEQKIALLKNINVTHLNITPEGARSFAIIFPVMMLVLGLGASLMIPLIAGSDPSFFFMFFFVIASLVFIPAFIKIPEFLANGWRMRASNQMVLSVFYIVTYMRHTSNLERAMEFASSHLSPPLSLDFKKLLWDVESGVFESIKEALDFYLETWRDYNLEFIEAIHLIESSLFESSNDRRLELLDKALEVILDETYEKMLHYAQDLKSPITMLHMLGVILPILGLVILPLVVSFMTQVKWYHLVLLYNVTLPVLVYFLSKSILSRRPTGYGETDIASLVSAGDNQKKGFNIAGLVIKATPMTLAASIGGILFFIGLMPMILFKAGFADFSLFGSYFSSIEFIGYKTSLDGLKIGPYGLGAAIISLAVPLSFALSIGLYYRMRSKNVIKIRNDAKKLETEFSSALFQLGSRLGDGLAAEVAFGKVADVMGETISGNFFATVSSNITRMGMGVEQAIFDPQNGAARYFPSNLIESSMKVLVESVKKGPKIAAQALMNISRYIKQIHTVDERLKDLLADIISNMKSQISFMTPVISGIVIGITSMITAILGQLSKNAECFAGTGGASANVLTLFGDGIPTYYFQVMVGIYVVQIVYILTIVSNGVENGSDTLNERFLLGQNLIRSPLFYAFVALIVMLVFNLIAGQILEGAFAGCGGL
ncbi:hypothetical protein GOV04_01945 [Candidatus Woesearchaeota archaeon]|nr:hypothetical protein [Candidatus Woesearchaeota archaeon]